MSDAGFVPFAGVGEVRNAGFREWSGGPGAERDTAAPVDEFARGFNEGQQVAQAAFAEERSAMQALLAAAQALQPVEPDAIRRLILETVERLVGEIVGRTPVDRAWLIEQVDRVVRVAGEVEDRKILWLNPDDIGLLAGENIAAELRPDPALVRGSLRLELESGWIEHGRMTMLDALRDNLGEGSGGK